jgi:hypothetical protein
MENMLLWSVTATAGIRASATAFTSGRFDPYGAVYQGIFGVNVEVDKSGLHGKSVRFYRAGFKPNIPVNSKYVNNV